MIKLILTLIVFPWPMLADAPTDLPNSSPITNYSECVAAGNPVTRSLPPQCFTPDGQRFIEESTACKNLCGDGKCTEVVCFADSCPCAESAKSCPADCKDLK